MVPIGAFVHRGTMLERLALRCHRCRWAVLLIGVAVTFGVSLSLIVAAAAIMVCVFGDFVLGDREAVR